MKQVQNGQITEVKTLQEVAVEGASYAFAVAFLAGVAVTGHKLRVKATKAVFRAIRK